MMFWPGMPFPARSGAATTLATGVAELSVQFMLDAQYIYSTGFQSATGFPSDIDVWRSPLAGGPEMPLASGGTFEDIAVDATHIFLTNQLDTAETQIVSVPVAGGPLTVLVPPGVVFSDVMVTDADHIYFQGTGLMRINTDGTGLITLAPASFNALAVDGQNVYWLEGDGTDGTINALKRVPIAGGTPTLVSPLSPAGGAAFALDETYVYWASGQNDIYRLPK